MSGALPIRQVSARVVERVYGGALGVPISLTITQDESWSPRVQGELTAPRRLLDQIERPNDSAALGKLQGDLLTIKLATRYGRQRTCADYTVVMLAGGAPALLDAARTPPIPWHPGEPIMPLSAATARWGASVAAVTAECGGSIAAITRALRQPGGAYDVPPTELRTVRVRRRKETPTDLEGTVTITLAGEDVRLHDARNTATAAYVNYYTSLRALVTDVLGKVYEYSLDIDRPKLTPGATVAITTGQEWKPAASAWEFLHPILEAAGWQLYADLAGVYQLEARIATPAPHGLDASVDLIDFVPVRDRTDGYYTAAMVEYTDGNPAIPAERWDVYAPAGSHRVAHETRPGKRLSAGAAEQIVARARARATPGTAQSTVQLDLLPGHRLPIRTPWRTEQATISALTHTYPAAETRYELRDIPTE